MAKKSNNDFSLTDYPTIKTRPTKNKKILSLYLYYYFGAKKIVDPQSGEIKYKHDIKRENDKLKGLFLYATPRNDFERNHNEETSLQAMVIRNRESDKLKTNSQYRPIKSKNIEFISWATQYTNNDGTNSKRTKRQAISLFSEFIGSDFIYPNKITQETGEGFARWLKSRTNGESANTYFKRLHTIIREGVKEKVFDDDPFRYVKAPTIEDGYKKEILTSDEITRLIQCSYDQQSDVIRNYVIFALFTGIRYGDAKELTWSNIDTKEGRLHMVQSKTRGAVNMPLKEGLLKIIGKPGKPNEKVFPNLPSNVMANKALATWTKKAKIDKHITTHSLRGTFCTLLALSNDYHTAAAMSGHKDLKVFLNRYAQPQDPRKKELIDNWLPSIKTSQTATNESGMIDVSNLTQQQKKELLLALASQV